VEKAFFIRRIERVSGELEEEEIRRQY